MRATIMRRRTAAAALLLVIAWVAAACTTAPPEGSSLYPLAEDGAPAPQVGQLPSGAEPPTEATVDLRVVGAMLGVQVCVTVVIDDAPPPWWDINRASVVGVQYGCVPVPVLTGDATVTVPIESAEWKNGHDSLPDAAWFTLRVQITIPPGGNVAPTVLRGGSFGGVAGERYCTDSHAYGVFACPD